MEKNRFLIIIYTLYKIEKQEVKLYKYILYDCSSIK